MSSISTAKRPDGRASTLAQSPIQVTSASGSQKQSKTISGGASMCTSTTSGSATTFRPRFRLRQALEAGKAVRPQLFDEFAHGAEPIRLNAVQTPSTVPLLAQQAGFLENLQMLRYGLQ